MWSQRVSQLKCSYTRSNYTLLQSELKTPSVITVIHDAVKVVNIIRQIAGSE